MIAVAYLRGGAVGGGEGEGGGEKRDAWGADAPPLEY